MSALVPTSARRWAERLAVARHRAATHAGDALDRARRRVRAATGTPVLPRAVWSAAERGPGPFLPAPEGTCAPTSTARLVPLPAAAALTRALTGARRPSLDAWSPLGPRSPESPAVLLLPVDSASPGAWGPSDAAAVAAERSRALPGTGLHTVLLTPPDELRELRSALRPRPGRPAVGVLLAPDDGTPRRAATALGLADAVVLPDPAAVPSALGAVATGTGRAVVGPADQWTPWPELADRGRAARLGAAAATPDRGTDESPARRPDARVVHEPRRVVVAGHDLKFAAGLVDELVARGHEVRVDRWEGHARHDVEASRALAAWADVVHCEWTLGNAVWHARHRGPSVRLTTRTHLQEAGTEFPARVRADAVDAWVFVADHVRAQVLRDTGVDAARTLVVPNAVTLPGDGVVAAALERPERRFVLGMVGVLPERKGLHRALDLLSVLRAQDPRYRLRLRGHRPREVAWMTGRDEERYYAAQERRISTDPLLADAVAWDPHGPDMDAWYARVGTVLSLSDFESFHFTLPDGAAHGCLPRSLAWAGADLLYPVEWLSPDTGTLADAVLADTADASAWAAGVRRAREHVRRSFAADVVTGRLADVVLGLA